MLLQSSMSSTKEMESKHMRGPPVHIASKARRPNGLSIFAIRNLFPNAAVEPFVADVHRSFNTVSPTDSGHPPARADGRS